ncbi:MAG: SHOCT domain-containing protein [Trueperaceae bacterium]
MAYAFGFGHGMGFGFGFLNFIGTILFIVLLFWAIKFVFRGGPWRYRGWDHRAQADDDAVRTARERLARGEIGAEEYETLRQGLKQDSQRGSGAPVRSWFEGRDSALELARMRFAEGEISREEFETIKKGLTG